jgi:hypothetical protein
MHRCYTNVHGANLLAQNTQKRGTENGEALNVVSLNLLNFGFTHLMKNLVHPGFKLTVDIQPNVCPGPPNFSFTIPKKNGRSAPLDKRSMLARLASFVHG